MKAYILSIAGVILIAALITVILPAGKMGKFVKGMAHLFVFAVMVSPFVSFFSGEAPSFSDGKTGEVDVAYLRSAADLLASFDEEEIAAYLHEEYALSAEISVKRQASTGYPIEKISVRLHDDGIFSEDARIHTLTRIKEALFDRYGCEAEVW